VIVASSQAWEARSLREVVTKLVDGSHNPPPKQDTGLPMLSARNIDRGQVLFDDYRLISEGAFASEHARTRIAPGDVLLTIVGTIGRTAVVPEGSPPFSLQRSVAVLTPSANLLPKFLCYQLESPAIQKHFEANARGTAQKGVYLKTLGQTPVVLPPLEVQREIVAELEKQFSRLDEAVANLQRVKANLKRYKASVLKAAVEGRLVETEGGWQKVKLGEIALSVRNGYSHKPDAESGTRIFRISAVRPMELAADDVRFLSGEPTDYGTFLTDAGDVLFTRYNGSRDYVGVCALVPAGLPPTVYPDKLIRVRVPQDELLPAFLVIAASTGEGREFIESMIRTTAGQSGVSGTDVKAIPIPLPSMAEQTRIVAEVDRHLSIIREVEAEVDTNLKRAHALRQATLAKAFAESTQQ
jgi:type I restriction enzyme S subunit